MKILIVAQQWFPDLIGGAARVVRATAQGLAQSGNEVVVIVPQAPGEPAISRVDGVEVRRVVRRSLLPFTVTDIYEMWRTINAVPINRFDVVLAHGEAATVGALWARSGRPIACVFHSSGFREARNRRSLGVGPVEYLRSLGVEPFLYLSERLALRYANRILVLSEFSRQLVLALEPSAESRLQIVGGGVDLDFFNPAPARDTLRQHLGVPINETVVMTARRLVNRMGVDVLLDAFSELRRARDDLRLVVAGDGEMRASLEAQRDQLGLAQSVEFLGRVSDSRLRDWYRAADLFVVPTIADEGFGLITAEALACGTPVVGTQVGATKEILGPLDESLLAAGIDAPSLASAIDRTLARRDASLRARCHEYAKEHLAWSAVLAQWESALRSAGNRVV